MYTYTNTLPMLYRNYRATDINEFPKFPVLRAGLPTWSRPFKFANIMKHISIFVSLPTYYTLKGSNVYCIRLKNSH